MCLCLIDFSSCEVRDISRIIYFNLSGVFVFEQGLCLMECINYEQKNNMYWRKSPQSFPKLLHSSKGNENPGQNSILGKEFRDYNETAQENAVKHQDFTKKMRVKRRQHRIIHQQQEIIHQRHGPMTMYQAFFYQRNHACTRNGPNELKWRYIIGNTTTYTPMYQKWKTEQHIAQLEEPAAAH